MDPRKILGVDANATQDEIQRAYRDKARKHHPDVGGDVWAFQQVQEAYRALTRSGAKAPAPVKANASRRSKQPDTSPQRPEKKNTRRKKSENKPAPDAAHHKSIAECWHEILVGELPLQTETSVFILINCLDIFMTHSLLRMGAVESNPIANFFIQKWDFYGAIFFKLAVVAVVCVIAQLVALKKPKTARGLLIAGSVIVGLVVIYSISLYLKHRR